MMPSTLSKTNLECPHCFPLFYDPLTQCSIPPPPFQVLDPVYIRCCQYFLPTTPRCISSSPLGIFSFHPFHLFPPPFLHSPPSPLKALLYFIYYVRPFQYPPPSHFLPFGIIGFSIVLLELAHSTALPFYKWSLSSFS